MTLDAGTEKRFVALVAKSTKRAERELRGTPLEVLRTLLGEGRNDEVVAMFSEVVARNALLERLVAQSRATKNSGEHISAEQLDIFLQALRAQAGSELTAASEQLQKTAEANGDRGDEDKSGKDKPIKQPPMRRPPPAGLRRVDNPISVPEAERPCPLCGGSRRCITHETTEVIDLIPAEVIVRLDRREVLACDACDGAMTRAPMGDKVVEGGYYGSGLVAEMVVDKYRDSLPLHRIGQRFEGRGLSIPSASMSDQIQWATDLLAPIRRGAIAAVLGAIVMHVDGTNLPVRDKETGHQVELGALWGYVGDKDHALYLFTSTGMKRGQLPGELGPEDFLMLRKGLVCADASNLFDKSFSRDDLIEVGCNMHARRYFVKALEAGDMRAAVPIKAFQALYEIEAVVRDADVDSRVAARRARSRPIYDELLRWGDLHRPLEPPTSKFGAALRYLDNHHVALTRFLDDGRLPVDNGIVERLHRRPAIGRRNFLFAGSFAGANRAAIAYTVLGCCQLANVDPVDYLRDVLPKLARGGVSTREAIALLPANWKTTRPAG